MPENPNRGRFPRVVFEHTFGWRVIADASNRFRLVSDFGNFGYIATFGTMDAAISYMNKEFLVLGVNH
jgi:hypothetical protein